MIGAQSCCQPGIAGPPVVPSEQSRQALRHQLDGEGSGRIFP